MKKKINNIKMSREDIIFTIINYIVLSVVLCVVIYPLIYIVSSSLSSTQAVISGKVRLLPVDFSLAGYQAIFKTNQIWVGYKNSIIYASLGTIINVVVTLMAAYPISRKDFVGRGLIMAIFTFTMLFNGGLIPTYMVVNKLRITNSVWAMVLPNAMAVWYMIIARTYFQSSIPIELQEAAEIDGCSDIGFIVRVVLPLSGPIIAVLALFYAVGHWNSYFQALIYLKSDKLYPLQIVLRNILIQNEMSPAMMKNIKDVERMQGLKELLKYSLIVVASIPVLLIYPFVQKYFIKGIMVGSIKG